VTLNIVLAGCGSISRAWLDPITQHPEWNARIVGLVDLDMNAVDAQILHYGLTDVVTGTDIDAVLTQTKPDIVFDCTIPDAHHSIAHAAFAHGCHLLGEKPLAPSLETARDMITAGRAAGVQYAIMQNRRYDPNIRRLKQVIESGVLGVVTTLNSDFYMGVHIGGYRLHMRYPLLVDMAIHTFDAARYILNADPVAVYCKAWNPPGSWWDHEASALAIFDMSDGGVYTYRGSWSAEGMPTTWESDWRAIGTRGSAVWDGATDLRAQEIGVTGAWLSELLDVTIPDAPTLTASGHAGCIEDFLGCVRENRTPLTNATDNIKSLAMVYAAIASAESGSRVAVDW